MSVQGEQRHLLVIDDDDRIRDLIKEYLARAGFRVSAAADAAAARRLVEHLSFDLLVLDVMMPGEDGFAFARWLRGRPGEVGRTPVLILTARGLPDDRIAGLALGADDYLAKPFAIEELAARLRALIRRRTGEDLVRYRIGDLTLDVASRVAHRAGRRIDLTGREFSLLECLENHVSTSSVNFSPVFRMKPLNFARSSSVSP